MENYIFKIIKDREDFINYEKGLYDAYSKASPDGWLVNNYKLINNKQLQPIIDYENSIIYAIEKDNLNMIYCGFNINVEKGSQIEIMGFSFLAEDDKKETSEGLTWFMIPGRGRINLLKNYETLFSYCTDDLKQRGFKILYGTSSRKLLSFYISLGYEPLDSIMLNNQEELLLRIKL